MNRPQSIEMLIDAPIGVPVFDAHDPIPEWIANHITHPFGFITRNLAEKILKEARGSYLPCNKIVYKVDQDEDRITLACAYDFHGRVYNIEI